MKTTADKIRWGTERRLEFIEFRLYWEGGVRRGDITEKFGVSTPQASADLGLYQQLAPRNLVYDSSEKRYVSTEHFQPLFLDLRADVYLAHLHDASGDLIRLLDSWMGDVPSAALMPVPSRRVKCTPSFWKLKPGIPLEEKVPFCQMSSSVIGLGAMSVCAKASTDEKAKSAR